MVGKEAALPGVGVTAVLPRRSYAPIIGRLLHDRTADKMASAISNIPHAVATIVPFDVSRRVELMARREHMARAAADGAAHPAKDERPDTGPKTGPEKAAAEAGSDAGATTEVGQPAAEEPVPDALTAMDTGQAGKYERPAPRAGITPIGSLTRPGRAVAEGRVHTVEIRPVEHNTVLACDIEDSTGELTALFYGRSHIPGLRPGSTVRLKGHVGLSGGKPIMINPAYQLLAPGDLGTEPPE
jgi:hypothetical protein